MQNVNECSKKEKVIAIVSEVSHLDEYAINKMLIEFFGWTDEPIEDENNINSDNDN